MYACDRFVVIAVKIELFHGFPRVLGVLEGFHHFASKPAMQMKR